MLTEMKDWLRNRLLRFLSVRGTESLGFGRRYRDCSFAREVQMSPFAHFEGRNRIDYGVQFVNHVVVGICSTIGQESLLHGGRLESEAIRIGNYVQLGPRVSIWAINHSTHSVTTYNAHTLLDGFMKQFRQEIGVSVGSDVWIGTSAILLPGVRVGHSSIVGAGAVVSRDVPPYSVAVGNPARVVADRFTPELRAALDDWKWWQKTPEELEPFREIFAVDLKAEPDRAIDLIRQASGGNGQKAVAGELQEVCK